MTPLQWFGLAVVVLGALGALYSAYLVGWSVSRQAAENLILAAERKGRAAAFDKALEEGIELGRAAERAELAARRSATGHRAAATRRARKGGLALPMTPTRNVSGSVVGSLPVAPHADGAA